VGTWLRLGCCIGIACVACRFQHGELATSTPSTDAPQVDGAVDAPGCTVEQISAAGNHACARLADGSVWCWGDNQRGESGRDPTTSPSCSGSACEPMPVRVALSPRADALGLGYDDSCAISGSDVYCWGANGAGEFGTGATGDSSSPELIAPRASATAIGGGYDVLCSLAGGKVSCSGGNTSGDLGNNTTTGLLTLVAVDTGVTVLGKGYRNTCAIASGAVSCWGDNSEDQIDTSGQQRLTPASTGVTGASQLVVGSYHVCARTTGGAASCWGDNGYGQIGDGTTASPKTPTTVALTEIAAITGSGYHTCALRSDGTVWCWGDNYTATPAQVTLPALATQLTSGYAHDCAVLIDGTATCWGGDSYGQLGDGSMNANATNPATKVALCSGS